MFPATRPAVRLKRVTLGMSIEHLLGQPAPDHLSAHLLSACHSTHTGHVARIPLHPLPARTRLANCATLFIKLLSCWCSIAMMAYAKTRRCYVMQGFFLLHRGPSIDAHWMLHSTRSFAASLHTFALASRPDIGCNLPCVVSEHPLS